MLELDKLAPKQIVAELDKFIIGQNKAKKAVAIALRNRVRRQKLDEAMRDEVAPKNIIMIGPTGVGKTEIARRLSKLCGAPFVKVEATKYTEVGYVGRDVESMVRDLMNVSVNMVKAEMREQVLKEAEARAEEIILDILLPGIKKEAKPVPQTGFAPPAGAQGLQNSSTASTAPAALPAASDSGDKSSSVREKFRKMLRNGQLEDKEIEVNVNKKSTPAFEIFAGTGLEDMDLNLGGFSGLLGGNKKKKRKMSVSDARDVILNDEIDRLIDTDKASDIARERVQEMGIIFIDEIDKVAGKENRSGADVSREGVQRDILPIVEGSKVNTKYGMIDTSHILFIAAGAFHMSKPSDLIPELQGRFPIRVELEALGAAEFEKILTQPENALIKQYIELMKTEDVKLDFTDDAVKRISLLAQEVNSRTENIGARRLHTIMEYLLEDISFEANDLAGQTITITPSYIDEKLINIIEDQDLSRYIL
ncbi:MAG: ATP-dependent protease ATPase subunit HslU [Spirochaetia bacterium]|jgi:ATP-dependent HslUV protease ATP-binding subunit HslU|nr:ATP-dependent protease ATPase subunit HslU [Spirochaetia bacterium]